MVFLNSRCKYVYHLLIVVVMLHSVAAVAMADGPGRVHIANVRYEATETTVIVHYDLVATKDEKYRTLLILKKESDSTFAYYPKDLEGDVGVGITAGLDRTITWNTNEEYPQGLDAKDYYFEISAIRTSKPKITIPWVSLGLAVLGGTAALWYASSLSTGDAPQTGPLTFPAPPGRPH